MRKDLERIFTAGLERVSPYKMISNHVSLKDNVLAVEMDGYTRSVDLALYKNIMLLGAGKASAPMARAFEEILGDRIGSGMICTKYGHAETMERVVIVEAGHPIPDENGANAAKRIAAMAQDADEQTLVITCISGGASALLPYPMDERISNGLVALKLEDKQQTTNALLRCGANITEINCVRKHISGIKGGRLLQMMHPARSLNFILSDVIGDDLGSIASGVTSYDTTTFAEARNIIKRYDLCSEVPKAVVRALDLGVEGRIAETVKPGDRVLENADNILIGTNCHALTAAAEEAAKLGYCVKTVDAKLDGEARDAARFLARMGKDVICSDEFTTRPACILVGGETVVTLRGDGKGGRNQEMALAFLRELKRWHEGVENIYFLAASTDGNDGPTDAAGAFADADALQCGLQQQGDAIEEALSNNDSYHFFDRIDSLFKTGPTNTNVCDLQVILIT